MKNALLTILLLFVLDAASAQKTDNYISATIDGKLWKAEAKRLKFKAREMGYLVLCAFEVNPDVQVWIRMWYQGDAPAPGTYAIEDLKGLEGKSTKENRPAGCGL